MSAPTPQQIAAFQAMFDHYNAELFDDALPQVILNFSRKAKALGFFAPERWQRASGEESDASQSIHEISINPSYLKRAEPKEIAQTLVHEMVHLWQQEHGSPGRRGYHNREWADKMEAVGLMPSSTGAEGGKRTGQRMSDYPIEGGAFEKAFDSLPESARFPWVCDDLQPKKPRKSSKTKFTCSGCGANAWGKPTLRVICGECDCELEEAA